MLLNCGVGEDWRVPWTARRLNQSILKEINVPSQLLNILEHLLYLRHTADCRAPVHMVLHIQCGVTLRLQAVFPEHTRDESLQCSGVCTAGAVTEYTEGKG